jgi:hypothetical protein
MRSKKEKIDNRPKYKIRLDHRTIITVRSMDAFKMWQEKYPEAKLVA